MSLGMPGNIKHFGSVTAEIVGAAVRNFNIDTRYSFCITFRSNNGASPLFFKLDVATGMIIVMMRI